MCLAVPGAPGFERRVRQALKDFEFSGGAPFDFQGCVFSSQSALQAWNRDVVVAGNLLDDGSFNYTYDAWGNRLTQTGTGGSGCFQPSYGYSANNQLTSPSGFVYDAAGNLTSDTVHTYTYDAKGQMVQVDSSTATYTYDAGGRRVGKTTTAGGLRNYIYDTDGTLQSEDSSTGFGPFYFYFGGKLVGEFSNSTTYYFHQDHLHSTRVLTDLSEHLQARFEFLPFGETAFGVSDLANTDRDFAGDVRDAESDPGNGTGNDYAMARHYGSRLGRFLTPDPAGTSATCLFNPQTQNRYAYVTNNPVNRTDPSGLCNNDGLDCGPTIGISLPFGQGGGGGNPAPPTPHPVFQFPPVGFFRQSRPLAAGGDYHECMYACGQGCFELFGPGSLFLLCVAACTIICAGPPN